MTSIVRTPINPGALVQALRDDLAANDGSGSARVSVKHASTGAVSRWVRDPLIDARITPQGLGAVGDGTADDTVALNKFWAAVAAGKPGHMVGGSTYKFTAALTQVSGNNINVTGDGATLLYAGTSATPGDLLSIGSGSTVFYGLRLKGFKIASSTLLSAGYALHVRSYVGTELNVEFDSSDNPIASRGNIFSGAYFDGCTVINLGTSSFYCTNDAVTWSSGVEMYCDQAYIKGHLVGGYGSGRAFYIGGGCGGFYAQNVTQLLNDVAIRIDTALTGTGNTQFFLDSGTFDTNKTASLVVNDTVSNALGKIIRLSCWMTGPGYLTGLGSGVIIANWAGGHVAMGNPTILNQGSSGVYCADPTTVITIGQAANIAFNGGFGVDASTPMSISSDASPRSCTLGAYAPNVQVAVKRFGSQALAAAAANAWAVDFTAAAPNTIAAAASVTLAAGSGMVMVHDNGNGLAAAFIVGGGYVSKLGGDASIVAGAPAASQIGLQFTGGAYKVVNGYAGSRDVYIGLMRTRPTT